jgi:hypothetical protein
LHTGMPLRSYTARTDSRRQLMLYSGTLSLASLQAQGRETCAIVRGKAQNAKSLEQRISV